MSLLKEAQKTLVEEIKFHADCYRHFTNTIKDKYDEYLKNGIQDRMFIDLLNTNKDIEILKEILSENEAYNSFDDKKLRQFSEELIYGNNGLINQNLDIDLIEDENLYIERVKDNNTYYIKLFSDIIDLTNDIGMLKTRKEKYKLLYENEEEYIASFLKDATSDLTDEEKELLYQNIIEKNVHYDAVFLIKPELKEEYFYIQEFKNNKNYSNNQRLANNNIITCIPMVYKIFEERNKLSTQEKLFRDFAQKNIQKIKCCD